MLFTNATEELAEVERLEIEEVDLADGEGLVRPERHAEERPRNGDVEIWLLFGEVLERREGSRSILDFVDDDQRRCLGDGGPSGNRQGPEDPRGIEVSVED